MPPQHAGSGDDGGLSDQEVLTRWLIEPDEDGAITMTVFRRYRELVRSELEQAGLPRRKAVGEVATVLRRARAERPETSLRDRLLGAAREVAAEAEPDYWRARTAVLGLVNLLPPFARAKARTGMLDLMEAQFQQSGIPVPPWMARLRDDIGS